MTSWGSSPLRVHLSVFLFPQGSSPLGVYLLSGFVSFQGSSLRVRLLSGYISLGVRLLSRSISSWSLSPLGVCLSGNISWGFVLSGFFFSWSTSLFRVCLLLGYISSQGTSSLGVHLFSGFISLGTSPLRVYLLLGLSPLRVCLFSGYISSWGLSPLGYIYQSTSHWGYLSYVAHPPKMFLAAPFCSSSCSFQFFLPTFPNWSCWIWDWGLKPGS